MKMGAPTKYKEEYCDRVDDYLEENQDEFYEFCKTRGDKSESYERHLTVKLPTVGGFASYLGVSEWSLYHWAKKYPIFSQTLDKILKEQKRRLINSGLSGDYNSTIAKLILSSNHGYAEKSQTENKVTLEHKKEAEKRTASFKERISDMAGRAKKDS